MFQLSCDSLLKKKYQESYISLNSKKEKEKKKKKGHSQTGSNIFVTDHMTGSGATTRK